MARSRWRRVGTCALLVAVAAVSGMTAASGASATPVERVLTQGEATRAYEEAQGPLQAAAEDIEQAAAGQAGRTGVSISPEDGEVRVHWQGTPPAGVARAVERASAGHGVRITFRHARYTAAEMSSLRDQLRHDQSVRRAGVRVMALEPDGSGLYLGVTSDPDQVKALPVVRQSPVQVNVEVVGELKPAGRWLDTTTYHAGSAIRSLNWHCSTAFGVKRPNGKQYSLTSGHCADPDYGQNAGIGEPWFAGDSTALHSTIATLYNQTHDAAMLEVPLGRSPSSGTYMGGVDRLGAGLGETTAFVRGKATSTVGAYRCTSGAFSGERCSIKIERNDAEWYFEAHEMGTPYDWLVVGIQAYRTDYAAAAGSGDSGGPALEKITNGVRGHGIISAVSNQVACVGITNEPNRYCGFRVYYSDINRFGPDMNITLLTA